RHPSVAPSHPEAVIQREPSSTGADGGRDDLYHRPETSKETDAGVKSMGGDESLSAPASVTKGTGPESTTVSGGDAATSTAAEDEDTEMEEGEVREDDDEIMSSGAVANKLVDRGQ